jgi:prevent-host-death family protein
MSEVNVTELRQNLPEYLAEVRKGKEVKVTVHGKVIARIVPEVDVKDAARRRLAALRAKCTVGDVISPAGERWDAERGRS